MGGGGKRQKRPNYNAQIQAYQAQQAQQYAAQKAADDAKYAKFQQEQTAAKAAADAKATKATANAAAAEKVKTDAAARDAAARDAARGVTTPATTTATTAPAGKSQADILYERQEADRVRLQAEADARTLAEQQRRDAEAKAAIDKKYQGELDTAYADRNAHVNQATNDVDALIAKERSKANIQGAEYTLTAEQRVQRINDQLANYRSATDDQRILDLASQYGDYAKSKGYSTTFEFSPGAKKKKETTVSTSTAAVPSTGTLLTADEDLTTKLGVKSILG